MSKLEWNVEKKVPGARHMRKTGLTYSCAQHPTAQIIPAFLQDPLATKLNVCRSCVAEDKSLERAVVEYALCG